MDSAGSFEYFYLEKWTTYHSWFEVRNISFFNCRTFNSVPNAYIQAYKSEFYFFASAGKEAASSDFKYNRNVDKLLYNFSPIPWPMIVEIPIMLNPD